jgi:AraC-like DNA-binding protein
VRDGTYNSLSILTSGHIDMANNATLPLIEASILGPVLSWLDGEGAVVERHLDRAHIPGELVAEGGWLSKAQVYGFLADVAERKRCGELAFASFEHFTLADLGPVAHAMRSAATAKESLDVFCRLASRAYEGNVFWLATDGGDVWFCNRVVDSVVDGHAYAQHASLMILLGVVRTTVGTRWRPKRVRLQAPETSAIDEIDLLQDCHVSFDQAETAVAFPRKLLSRRLAGGGRGSRSHGAGRSELSDLLSHQEGFAESLQRLIASHFSHTESPSLEHAARVTGVSQRTIKRRLFDEGLTYRGILDRIRFESARKMLVESELSVGQIAREVGYSGPNNFIRAFKRISGVTPIEYRVNPPGG